MKLLHLDSLTQRANVVSVTSIHRPSIPICAYVSPAQNRAARQRSLGVAPILNDPREGRASASDPADDLPSMNAKVSLFHAKTQLIEHLGTLAHRRSPCSSLDEMPTRSHHRENTIATLEKSSWTRTTSRPCTQPSKPRGPSALRSMVAGIQTCATRCPFEGVICRRDFNPFRLISSKNTGGSS